MYPEYSGKIFDEYFDSIFKDSNVLTPEQFEKTADSYEAKFGEFMPQGKNSRILDIGCGCGHFLYYLQKNGYTNFYGIDMSSQQVDYCRKNISDKVQIADTFEFLKDKRETYDLISMIALLEHIPKEKIINLLCLAYGALRKEGTLFVQVPNMSNPFSINLRYRDFSHEVGFTEVSLKQVLWLAGFRDIHIFSPRVRINSFRTLMRSWLVNIFHGCLRFLYYIQDYNVPDDVGRILVAVSKKRS